ncbi:hypothetical protein AVEN_62786-1 [Araneus ventricosus]|uniref:Uncharacterized protein n=1 Tax=Araneus ventricosus TaxID=182803 RepID=A0A4Y2Q295_ARAVE|nr:hypothetical protein AVEN_223542-1 [Araneus ventricosus]GBN56545.1 hypothetical protein AVEN_62786-1 [Araneus ventricosus]
MKVRRESDCKLNLDSSENITQDHCCGVHNACSLLQANRRRHNCQIPVHIRRCNSGETCAVTSTHITIILESLPKPGDDTLGDSKFLGYFQLGTSTFQSSDNSTK